MTLQHNTVDVTMSLAFRRRPPCLVKASCGKGLVRLSFASHLLRPFPMPTIVYGATISSSDSPSWPDHPILLGIVDGAFGLLPFTSLK